MPKGDAGGSEVKTGVIAGLIVLAVTVLVGWSGVNDWRPFHPAPTSPTATASGVVEPTLTPSAPNSPATSSASSSSAVATGDEPTSATSSSAALPPPHTASLSELCNYPDVMKSGYCPVDPPNTVEIAGRVFTYEEFEDFWNAQPPEWDPVVKIPNANCTHIRLNFGLEDRPGGTPATANIRVVTSGGHNLTASTRRGHLGTLDGPLPVGAFDIQTNSTTGAIVYVAGTATCMDLPSS